MTDKLPQPVEGFKQDYPEVWKAFTQLGGRLHEAGPLDEQARRLVKLALSIGAGLEGATHSAVRNALAKGITPEEIKHVAVLAITTLGFPATVRALTWISDYLKEREQQETVTSAT
jgi:alkylhydroperoxidase/carboxymuconolactone decarboxylase family protein YurZ